jgi:hypothetical protein
MTLNIKTLWSKITNNKRLILEVTLAFFLLFSLYRNFTSYNESDKIKKEDLIRKIDEKIAKNQEVLKTIQLSIDSIHLENKYLIQSIDGTLLSLKKLEKVRYEKVNNIRNNPPDSTISYLTNRYKSKLP